MSRIAIVAAALIAAGIWWWNGRVDMRPAGPNGFVAVTMPDGVEPNTVVILAPLNCPSDAAQRAEQLAESLTRMGIRNVRSSSYSSEIADPTAAQRDGLKRAVEIMEGTIPAVFVNGMGRANPTPEQVAAEYRRTKS